MILGEADGAHNNSPDILREFAGFLTDVSDVVASIEATEAPHDKNDMIHIQILRDDEIVIPDAIKNAIGEVTSVLISFDIPEVAETEKWPFPDERPVDPMAPSVSIDFYGKEKSYHLSRVDGIETEDTDYVIEIQPLDSRSQAFGRRLVQIVQHQGDSEDEFLSLFNKVPAVSTADFNTFLMSLAYPDGQRGYDMFRNSNLLSKEVLLGLREAVDFGLNEHTKSIAYSFTSTEQASLTFTHTQGQPLSFCLAYDDPTFDRTVIVRHNLESDFNVSYSSIEHLAGINQDTVDAAVTFAPNIDDIRLSRTVIQRELNAIQARTVELTTIDAVDPEHLDPADHFMQSGQDYFSPQYTNKILNGLDFDPKIDSE